MGATFSKISFVAILLFTYSWILTLFEFQAYSPDSLRFIHFWQNSFEGFIATDGNLLTKIQLFAAHSYDALLASSHYDLGRGRILLYSWYGLETFLFYLFQSLPQNFLISATIFLNSHAIASLATKNVENKKLLAYFSIFVVVTFNAISFSPIMYFALYAKYICLTFILYYFIFNSFPIKAIMLICAAFTDEIGLLFALMLCFFVTMGWLQERWGQERNFHFFSRLIFSSAFICLSMLILFFLFIFFAFDASPFQFSRYAARSAIWLLDTVNLLNKFIQLGWTLEVLILGFSLEAKISSSVFTILFIGYFSALSIRLMRSNQDFWNFKDLFIALINLKSSSLQFLIFFWSIATLILLIILPASQYAYQTYSYPVLVSLSLVFFGFLRLLLKPDHFSWSLCFLACIHFLALPNMSMNINDSNTIHLLKDSSVSVKDLIQLNASVHHIRSKQDYSLFMDINNHQELDYSGMWYYSRMEHFRFSYKVDDIGNPIQENYYYPIHGSVRVLGWPYFKDPIESNASVAKRSFQKNKAIYQN